MGLKKQFFEVIGDPIFYLCILFDFLDFVITSFSLVVESATLVGIHDVIQAGFTIVMIKTVGDIGHLAWWESLVDLAGPTMWYTGLFPTYTMIYLIAKEKKALN